MEKEEKVQIADGKCITIKREIDLNFALYNDSKKTYRSKFHVIEEKHDNAIIGMRFLKENDVIIDFKRDKITIDDNEYNLNSGSSDICFADKKLIEKSKVLNISRVNDELEQLINHYKEINPKIGDIGIKKHYIVLTERFNRIMKEYPVPLGIRDEVKNHLDELITNKIITETNTEFISPAFIIRKKNGKIRLVVDYRYLNSITKKTNQFVPKISEILSCLKCAKYFSQIDLNQGYCQIHVNKDDIPKKGFIILNRTFVFNKMPFGPCNAPSTFQLAMNEILKNIKNVFIYMDDILLYSETYETHIDLINETLLQLIKSGVSINFEKSTFAAESVNYLGHVITKDGIRPDISKIERLNICSINTKKD
ncbi:Retrovirus-related Pol polyprotein from transposon opus [Dictyocoela muelleri]|nr:Retrovirus-related Pol polyprotein from transposon opus [Dictyocoela muelleri]